MDALNDGFQPLSMFVDPNEWDEKGCGSIHSRATPVTAVSVGPTVSESFQFEDADSARTLATRAFTNLSALLNNPHSRYLMGLNGVPYRSIPGAPNTKRVPLIPSSQGAVIEPDQDTVKQSNLNEESIIQDLPKKKDAFDETTASSLTNRTWKVISRSDAIEGDGDYSNLILESSVIKVQRCLQEDIEHARHAPSDDLDPLYFIPVINWLFLRLQEDSQLRDGRVCRLCQFYRIQKLMDGALVQIILAIALMIFIPLPISAAIVVWNTFCIFLEGARSSFILEVRTLSHKEERFVRQIGSFSPEEFQKLLPNPQEHHKT